MSLIFGNILMLFFVSNTKKQVSSNMLIFDIEFHSLEEFIN